MRWLEVGERKGRLMGDRKWATASGRPQVGDRKGRPYV